MKLQTLFLLSSALALTTVAGMVQAESSAVPYEYGMPMDIQKVLAMKEPQTNECQVITATIKFVDRAGDVQNVSYPKMSEVCLFQN
ncbi:DUF2790 domain-containing protein [Pseudomonas sp. L1(2025)]|uniref:DUF2790 domain-containing protein n=1 Tax=Pseudomonas sp. L1(2025) TaxID=3449429 RepID=UPI003F68D519